jgi:hypothetical protein
MKKALHIFAADAKTNSGDFFLGPSTKWQFQNIIGTVVSWKNFNARKKITKKDLLYFNTFDYIIIGGGGLFLPDSNPNSVSCWQFAFPTEFYSMLTPNVYVISIGWNHFYNQDITMPTRGKDRNTGIPQRAKIFKDNVEKLIEKSVSFTMRHNGDCNQLKKVVDPSLHSKIEFAFCPVIGYVKNKYLPRFENKGVYHTFEIKDDRPHRRYFGTSHQDVFKELLGYIQFLLARGEKIAVMRHDSSIIFAVFLRKNQVPFTLLDNTVANEEKIIRNYSQVKKLYCTAGHSQMTAYALGLNFHSLISHDKLEYFLRDIGRFDKDANNYTYVRENALSEKLKLRYKSNLEVIK